MGSVNFFELQDVGRKNRKSFRFYGGFHPKLNRDRLYVTRK